MKLVEVKNSLAKLYFQPTLESLVLSDFIKVNDDNKVLLAQVVSIDSTSQEDTNCAVLKFALDINNDNTFSSYSGYTPALNARVEVASADLLSSVFSSGEQTFVLGNLSSTFDIPFKVDVSLLDNFLYIQSDSIEEKQSIFEKIAQFNLTNDRKTIIVDCENLTDYHNVKVVELTKDFKLPISSSVLSYIYENDLNGLTLEQKTIVQDIILEIEEYIKTLDSGYIPFNSLLDVVNSIYEADKSTGIILLRNKLLKYKQANLFASNHEEVISIIDALNTDKVIVLNLSKIEAKWQQEAINFVLDNIDDKFYLLANVDENNVTKSLLGRLYKQNNVVPVISSNYKFDYSIDLKSFAKNLLMFRPLEQQKAFATYNSFLSKLAHNEFVISGVSTFYTPLIIKDLSSVFVISKPLQDKNIVVNDSLTEDVLVDVNSDTLDVSEQPIELTLEDEIAKDVDDMFYSKASLSDESIDVQNVDELLSEDDLSLLDELDEVTDSSIATLSENGVDDLIPVDDFDSIEIDNVNTDSQEKIDVIDDTDVDSELDLLVSDDPIDALPVSEDNELISDELPGFNELDNDVEVENEPISVGATNDSILENTSIPVYSTQDDAVQTDSTLKISEGNIVYHARFGKGVVEELFSHGNRIMCSILFDQYGRRLLDPSIADLKQM